MLGVLRWQELASLGTKAQIAAVAIPELGLVQVEAMTTLTRVETWLPGHPIMETKTSKPWDTFW